METGLVFVGAVFLLLGAVFAYVAWRHVRRRREVAETPTTPAASLRPGRVEVAGVAEPGPQGLVKSPITGREALHVSYVVEEERRDAQGRTRWRDLDRGEIGAPFLLRDDTGAVLVDAHEAELEAPERTMPLDGLIGSMTPDLRVRWSGGGGPSLSLGMKRRRVRERVLLPGARLYALGDAQALPAGGAAPFLLSNGAQKLLVSTKSEAHLLRTLLMRALLFGTIAVLLLGVSAWALPAGIRG